jgi:hypothetical protein
MAKQNSILFGLTDEEILDEFVKRFDCDGAILIYLDGNTEYGFSRSTTVHGRAWTTELFTAAKNHLSIPDKNQEICEAEELRLAVME